MSASDGGAPVPSRPLDAAAEAAAPPAPADLTKTTDPDGKPLDVGLLILGHSTSQVGDYPAKLAAALKANASGKDGRNYVVFRAATGGDGGLLWIAARFQPTDLLYNRVLASRPQVQYEQDAAGNRWSCRRLRLERLVSAQDPAPGVLSDCAPEPSMSCTYTEGGVLRTESIASSDCWKKMDLKLALIQDTTNRSWPIDDFDADGTATSDYWPVRAVKNPDAIPCGGAPANPNGSVTVGASTYVDWNCDGKLDASDRAADVYAGWLESLSKDLLGFGVDHVFLTQKPMEFGAVCGPAGLFPGEAACAVHASRAPTPSRPYTAFYNPYVYWEHTAIEALFAKAGLDARLHPISAGDPKKMWNESVGCFASGKTTWAVPASAGRPGSVSADANENDGASPNDPSSAQALGCLVADHVHHTTGGGWMIADTWYAGLTAYLLPK